MRTTGTLDDDVFESAQAQAKCLIYLEKPARELPTPAPRRTP